MLIKEIEALNKDKISKEKYLPKIYRKIAIYCVKILLYTPITPNQISIFGISLIFIAAIFFARGDFWVSMACVFLLYLSEICDYIDGTLARCKKMVTKLQGNLLESFGHEPLTALIVIGIAFGVYTNTNNINYLFLGIFGGVSQLLTIYTLKSRDYLLLKHAKKVLSSDTAKTFIKTKMEKIILNIFVVPLVYYREIILIVILFNKLDWLTIFYGIFLPIRSLLFFVWTYLNFKKLDKKI